MLLCRDVYQIYHVTSASSPSNQKSSWRFRSVSSTIDFQVATLYSPSRHLHLSITTMPQPHRPTKPNSATPHRRPKPTHNNTLSSRTSTNAIKKRKRDLRRLLEHAEKLPANIRISHERELASCDTELETAKEMARRSQMIKKYHMVRFFGMLNTTVTT